MNLDDITDTTMTEKLVDDGYDIEYDVITSVWQLWKDKHAPRWFKKWFPVRKLVMVRRINLEAFRMYPDVVPSPNLGTTVVKQFISVDKPQRR